jgi:hypothetical protein
MDKNDKDTIKQIENGLNIKLNKREIAIGLIGMRIGKVKGLEELKIK